MSGTSNISSDWFTGISPVIQWVSIGIKKWIADYKSSAESSTFTTRRKARGKCASKVELLPQFSGSFVQHQVVGALSVRTTRCMLTPAVPRLANFSGRGKIAFTASRRVRVAFEREKQIFLRWAGNGIGCAWWEYMGTHRIVWKYTGNKNGIHARGDDSAVCK